jgi:hypothetical protein
VDAVSVDNGSRSCNKYYFAATTLCAFHYITCAVAMWVAEHLGLSKPVKVPIKGTSPAYSDTPRNPLIHRNVSDLMVFVVTSSISIGSLNLSLMLNSVGFYQVTRSCDVCYAVLSAEILRFCRLRSF